MFYEFIVEYIGELFEFIESSVFVLRGFFFSEDIYCIFYREILVSFIGSNFFGLVFVRILFRCNDDVDDDDDDFLEENNEEFI